MIKMLVYLDNDPLARRRMEAALALLRATYYEGPGGRLSNFLNGPQGIGNGCGREHSETGDFAAAGYACGRGNWRSRWLGWHETFVDVLAHVQTPGGVWGGSASGKTATSPPLGNGNIAFFRVVRPNEHTYCEHGLRGLKESVFGNGVDPARYSTSKTMLIDGGAALWNLLWRWKQDLSGPNGNGPWDRVAVGPVGANPIMFLDHADHPPEQFTSGVILDSYSTGLGLTYWFVEAPFVTTEMQTALETYWRTSNVLSAALGDGISCAGRSYP